MWNPFPPMPANSWSRWTSPTWTHRWALSAISIEQRSTSHNPRSTVGRSPRSTTISAPLCQDRASHCPNCGWKSPPDHPADCGPGDGHEEGPGSRSWPPRSWQEGEHAALLQKLRKDGFTRVKIDGRERLLDEEIALDKKRKHDISAIVTVS